MSGVWQKNIKKTWIYLLFVKNSIEYLSLSFNYYKNGQPDKAAHSKIFSERPII